MVDEAGDDEPMQLDESEWEKFERGPVVWSGGVSRSIALMDSEQS